jgi:hypothetical protein
VKRHPALHKLSHDHHHGLVMALRLKKGGPASPNDNWPMDRSQQVGSLLAFASNELFPHFEIEEMYLLGIAGDELDERLLEDHREVRELLAQIEANSDIETSLKRFGEKLEAHIRFEEREFFPQLQEILGEERLSALADKLHRL